MLYYLLFTVTLVCFCGYLGVQLMFAIVGHPSDPMPWDSPLPTSLDLMRDINAEYGRLHYVADQLLDDIKGR